MIPWFLSTAFAADCGFSVTDAELHTALEAAEQAYAALDVASFRAATDGLRVTFPCLDAPVQPATAARVARVRALALSTTGEDDERVRLALAAAKELDPTYVFPSDLLPEGHELRATYEALGAEPPPPATRMPRPKGVELLIDGTPSTTRPEHRLAFFQVQDDGQVRDTRMLWPSDPAPPYPTVPVERNRLLWTAAGLGAASLAAYGGAWASRGALETAEGSDALKGVQRRTNVLTGVSVGFAIGAGASTAAALLVGNDG